MSEQRMKKDVWRRCKLDKEREREATFRPEAMNDPVKILTGLETGLGGKGKGKNTQGALPGLVLNQQERLFNRQPAKLIPQHLMVNTV